MSHKRSATVQTKRKNNDKIITKPQIIKRTWKSHRRTRFLPDTSTSSSREASSRSLQSSPSYDKHCWAACALTRAGRTRICERHARAVSASESNPGTGFKILTGRDAATSDEQRRPRTAAQSTDLYISSSCWSVQSANENSLASASGLGVDADLGTCTGATSSTFSSGASQELYSGFEFCEQYHSSGSSSLDIDEGRVRHFPHALHCTHAIIAAVAAAIGLFISLSVGWLDSAGIRPPIRSKFPSQVHRQVDPPRNSPTPVSAVSHAFHRSGKQPTPG